MNPKENFISCLRCEAHDRVPTFLFDLTFGMNVAGYTTSEIFVNGFDGTKSAKSLLASRRLLGHDAVVGSVLAVDSRIFGGEVDFPPHGTPTITSPAFADPHTMYDYDPNAVNNKTMDEILCSYNTVRRMDPEAVIVGHVPSPFLLAASFRGFENLMMDIAVGEDYLADLLKFTHSVSEILLERIICEGNPDCMLISAAYDNIDIIGMDNLSNLCLPSIEDLVRKGSDSGKDTILHPHGSLTSCEGRQALELFLSAGIKCIYYGENNDSKCLCDFICRRSSIMGGIDTFSTIFLGPDSRVVDDTNSELKNMAGENYIFSCSCSIDRGLDAKRLEIMMNSVKNWNHAWNTD